MTSIADRAVERLHELTAILPESTVGTTVHHPSIKVRNKAFTMYVGPGRESKPAFWIKAGPGIQEELLAIGPDRYFKPPYVGPKGWVGVWLDRATDWDECDELIADAYRLSAPKRLVQQMDQSSSST